MAKATATKHLSPAGVHARCLFAETVYETPAAARVALPLMSSATMPTSTIQTPALLAADMRDAATGLSKQGSRSVMTAMTQTRTSARLGPMGHARWRSVEMVSF